MDMEVKILSIGDTPSIAKIRSNRKLKLHEGIEASSIISSTNKDFFDKDYQDFLNDEEYDRSLNGLLDWLFGAYVIESDDKYLVLLEAFEKVVEYAEN